MDDVAFLRALHVLAVVWIGAIAMVALILLPAIRRTELGPNPLRAFKAIERRFSWRARIAMLIVGLIGLNRLDWSGRFDSIEFSWMHAMRRLDTICSAAFCD